MTRGRRAAVVIGAAVLVTAVALGSQVRVPIPMPARPVPTPTSPVLVMAWDAIGDEAWVGVKDATGPNGRSGLFRTVDGGRSWERLPNPIPNAFPIELELRGGAAYLVIVRDESAGTPQLFEGTGGSWRPLAQPPFAGTPSIDAAAGGVLWAWNDSTALALSRDDGRSWQPLRGPIGRPLLHQLDGGDGWVVVDDGALVTVERSTDQGASFKPEPTTVPAVPYVSSLFRRADGALVMAFNYDGLQSGVLVRGTDGTWKAVSGPNGAALNGRENFGVAADGTYWMAGGRSMFVYNGDRWLSITPGMPAGLSLSSVRGGLDGRPRWAVATSAAGNTLLHSEDGGQVWAPVRLPEVARGSAS